MSSAGRQRPALDWSKAGSNYYFDDLTNDERKVFDDGASAIRDVEALFAKKWLPVGRAVVLARDCAKRINKNDAYLRILHERGVAIDGPACSHLLRIMDNLDGVLRWYSALPANQKREWTHPRSVIRHCTLFHRRPRARLASRRGSTMRWKRTARSRRKLSASAPPAMITDFAGKTGQLTSPISFCARCPSIRRAP
jgi:hypothetical protein